MFLLLKQFLIFLLQAFTFVLPLLISVAFYTLAERKVMAAIQRRIGPNVVGFAGLLQPIADGVKLIFKEAIIPFKANRGLFLAAPKVMLVLTFLNWSVIPFSPTAVFFDHNLSLIFVYALSSLSVYGIIASGWASNSKYAFLGALRSTAQMISYEVSLGFILVCVGILAGSFNLLKIVEAQQNNWFLFPLFPLFFIFLVSILAETNRVPFDLPEAEAEIVAGYNTEYSSMTFAMFFLAEYSNMLIMSTLTVICFLGGWYIKIPFIGLVVSSQFLYIIKILLVSFFFIWVRGTLPRYRYDQLMLIGWKFFLPFTLSYLLFLITVLYVFDGFKPQLVPVYLYK